jgi:RNA polymerase sigma-70 factor (ECF subfamily)
VSDSHELQALIRRAQQQDRSAQSALYTRCAAEVYSLLRRMTGDDDVAADLSQNTWIKAFERIDQYQAAGTFCAWVSRVARRVALDHFKSRQVRDREPLDPHQGSGAPSVDGLVDRMAIEDCLDALPEGYRKVLVLRLMEGLSHQEIADELGTTSVTSRTQFHKARARMILCLEHR